MFLGVVLASLPFIVTGGCGISDETLGAALCEEENKRPRVHQENEFRAPDFDHSKLKVEIREAPF